MCSGIYSCVFLILHPATAVLCCSDDRLFAAALAHQHKDSTLPGASTHYPILLCCMLLLTTVITEHACAMQGSCDSRHRRNQRLFNTVSAI